MRKDCTPDDPLAGLQQLIQQRFPIKPRVALGGKLCVKVQVAWCTAFDHLQWFVSLFSR